ncbi:hypothetical protein SAMN05446037_1009122 [Anaerovirgula multivorans]|uniref:Uncharacterized protein n=1 Tax=Anaerovirgula multivorans TaxID=312168 RepID=A0A239E8U1_9FIRM|nr:hypothetical protein SAMN05446037_1009122 [Anaerovirgula multivorans]
MKYLAIISIQIKRENKFICKGVYFLFTKIRHVYLYAQVNMAYNINRQYLY